MQLYRFSPINDEAQFDQALEYIARQLKLLAEKVLGEMLPVDTLKVFAHYPDEFERLKEIVAKRGESSDFSSATSLYVETDFEIGEYHIQYLGVRIADPYRAQVGCGDLVVEDYETFRARHLRTTSSFTREITKGELTMLELWHPDFDVLGYIVKG